MEILNTLKEENNALFKRKEVKLEVKADVPPSESEAKKLISEKYKASPDAVRVLKTQGKFGTKNFEISANIYESKKDLFDTENFSKKQLEKIKKAEAEAKKPEEKSAEAPVEEKTQEAKE